MRRTRFRKPVRFGGLCALLALSQVARPSNRRATLLPSQKHGTSAAFALRLVCRVSSPGPRGRGAEVQNAGDEGSRWSPPARGRRLVSGCVGVFLVRIAQHREVGRRVTLICLQKNGGHLPLDVQQSLKRHTAIVHFVCSIVLLRHNSRLHDHSRSVLI